MTVAGNWNDNNFVIHDAPTWDLTDEQRLILGTQVAAIVEGDAPETIAAMPLDDQTLRELGRSAANVRTWTTKRNEQIRAAHAAGGGVREIARATGLNVATVHNILKPRSRGATS